MRLPSIDFESYYRDAIASDDYRRIAPVLSYAEDVHRLFSDGIGGLPLPWTNHFRIRPRELTVWAGVNGHGKSLLLGQAMLHLAKLGQKVCILSMEMPPARTIQRMIRQAVGTWDVSPDYRSRFLMWGADRIWIADFERTVNVFTVMGVLMWAHRERGCQQFVIDSMMKCGMGEDDYNGQKSFVDMLTAFAKAHDSHVHLVAHSRKRDREDSPMDKFDIKGSGAITDMADNCVTVFRNKRKERAVEAGQAMLDNRPIDDVADALMRVDKQRHGDWEGVIPMRYHKPSMQYTKGERMDIITTVLNEMDAVA